MNNTLTGLGLALVLALVAALIGPWFVNWTAYRDDFAREASALVGAPVKVTGAVDVRLLPTPYVRFRGLSAGSGAASLSVDEVEIELAIAPLMRGEFKAARARLVRPRFGLEVSADGAVRTAFSGNRRPSAAVSLDRVEVVDGVIAATTPSGAWSVGHVSGLAEVGSLAGPFRFEGAAGSGNNRVQARLSTSRLDDAGALRLKLALLRDGRPGSLDLDGGLTLGSRPEFAGRIVAAQPVAKDDKHGAEPWRLVAETKAGAGRLALSEIDFMIGAEERAIRLGGRVEARLERRPRLDLAIETRQVDLDRFLGADRPKTPAGVLAVVADKAAGAELPAIDAQASLDIRGVVAGGDVVQDLKANLVLDAGDWRVRDASATAPGGARLKAQGSLAFSGAVPGFAGDIDATVADLPAMRRWLSGGAEAGGPVRGLAVKGKLKAGASEIAIDDATLVADGARSLGRVAWRAGGGAGRDRVEAALISDDLDLDALGVDRLLKTALEGRGFDLQLSLDANTLRLSGVRMTDVSVDGVFDAAGLDLKRLEIRDAEGAAIDGAGRLARGPEGYQGHLSFDLESKRIGPLLTLARIAGAPEPALRAIAARGGELAPLKLEIDIEAGAVAAKVEANGEAAGGRVEARVSAAELSADAPADVELRIVSEDGRKLAALAGLALSPAASAPGGEASLKLSGALAKGMRGEGRLAALGLDLTAKGAVALAPVTGLSAEGDLALRSADLSAFGEAIGRLTPGSSPGLPAVLAAKVAIDQDQLRFDGLKGEIAGSALTGSLTIPLSAPNAIGGRLAFGELAAGSIAGLALSPQAAPLDGAPAGWSAAPFGPAPTRGLAGRLEIAADRMRLFSGETVTEARFGLALRPSGLAVEAFTGKLDGGALSGSASIVRNGDDATVGLVASLRGLAADRLAGGGAAAGGAIDLDLEAQATGRSPSALIGAMTGAGTLSLRDARIRRLDVSAIDRIEPRVEAGLPLEAPKIASELDRELNAADLVFQSVSAPFTISGGVARSGALDIANGAARLGGGAALDLRRLALDADLTLRPNRAEAPQIGVSFEGPLGAPRRRVDATGFTGWLSVRAVERETKRIEAMEADIRERARVARLRAEEERKKAEAEKLRLEEERRKAEIERRKREAEVRALTDGLPKPASPATPGLPSGLDLSAPDVTATPRPAPPVGVFAPQGQSRPGGALVLPQSILPPGVVAPGR